MKLLIPLLGQQSITSKPPAGNQSCGGAFIFFCFAWSRRSSLCDLLRTPYIGIGCIGVWFRSTLRELYGIGFDIFLSSPFIAQDPTSLGPREKQNVMYPVAVLNIPMMEESLEGWDSSIGCISLFVISRFLNFYSIFYSIFIFSPITFEVNRHG